MLDLLRKIFPSANQRRISEYTKIVKKINALEDEMSSKDEGFFKELLALLGWVAAFINIKIFFVHLSKLLEVFIENDSLRDIIVI